jgi:hypothetical protein
MAGLVPATHVFLVLAWDKTSPSEKRKKSVDGRHKAGHDDLAWASVCATADGD